MRTPALPSPRRRGLAGLTVVSLVAAPLAFGFATTASAVSPNVVISEVYGAGGNANALFNADFVELSNPTAAPVSLAGTYIHYRSAAGGSGGAPLALSGSVPANGTYLIQMGATGATGAALPAPDAGPGTYQMAAAGGQVFLLASSTAITTTGDQAGVAGVIDMVGVSGATSFETAAATVAGSTSNSVNRTAADADKNNVEFGLAAPTPKNSGPATPTALEATDPADQTGQVGSPVTGFTLQATGGTSPYTWTATGTPPGVSVATNGAVSGTPTTEGVYTVTATATDSATTPATDSVEFTYTISAAASLRPISDIQGTGAASPLLGQNVKTRGIVTAAYPSGGFFGFYIQTPGTGSANIDLSTHTASDGIFVYQPSGAVTTTPGSYVEVTGKVTEYAGATQLTVASADITVVNQTVPPVVTTTTATWPRSAAEKESLEGMKYRPTGDFTVSNTFSTNNFGEVGLANGTTPLIQRTEVELPGPAGSSPTEADNIARAVVLDDGASTNFLATSSNATTCGTRPTPCLVNGGLTPPYISTTEPVRVGAPTTFVADVIFTQGGSPTAPTYRFQPLATVVGPDNANSPATFVDTRTAAPDEALINEVGVADLKVASFNVLNYFTTLGDANDDNIGDNGCTPYRDRDYDGNTVNSGCDSRGAWDPEDFERQQSKIVSAINALDADVVGLMEIENSATLGETPGEATNSLVAALNADAGAGTWAANPSSTELPAGGMDVITNAIIFKPASVDRVGESRALGTLSDAGEAFNNAREPLGQIFKADAGGDPFLFVVNHFKSKGSAGPNPGDADSGDGQGSSNGSRVLQATALRDWVTGLQTASSTDAVVLAGDFNSYSMEDPLRVLYSAGYANVEQEFGNGEFSYSFSGLSGSLDHILVNNAALARSTGTDIWNINGGESLALEYSRWNYHGTDFHAEGPYRSSDHDPVILGMKNSVGVANTAVTGSAGSFEYGTAGSISVKVAPATATGTVTASKGAEVLGSTTLTAGAGTVALAAKSLPVGTHVLTLAYSGDARHKPSTGSVTVVVSKADATVKARVKPKKVFATKTRARVIVKVSAEGITPTGKVRVKIGKKVYRATLEDGRAVVKLKKFAKPGKYKAKVRYKGNAKTEAAWTRITIRVKRR